LVAVLHDDKDTTKSSKGEREKMEMNNETRAVVNRMFTEDEVALGPLELGRVNMQHVADALMVKNVRVKKLTHYCLVDIEDAEALRDALQVNHTLNVLAFEILSVHCFVGHSSRYGCHSECHVAPCLLYGFWY
jgi:hypothetical protein